MAAATFGLNALLAGPLGLAGLGLGTALSSAGAVCILLWRVHRRVGGLEGRQAVRSVALSLATALAGGLAGRAAYAVVAGVVPGPALLHQVLRLGAGLGVVVAVHAGLSIVLGNAEGKALLAGMLTRRKPPPPDA